MHTTKEAALESGELFYFNNRACRRGHLSKRYASSGNCVECMEERAEQVKIKNKASRRIANERRFNTGLLFAANFPQQWHPILEKLSYIAQGDDDPLKQRIIATIAGASVDWDAAAFAKAGVQFNGQYIVNAQDFPIGTPFSIRVGELWWPGAELLACLRGEIPTVSPCNFIPQVAT